MKPARRNTAMKAIKNTWKTLNDCLGIVVRARSYSVYPLLSYTIILLITFSAIIPLLESALRLAQSDMLAQLLLFATVFLAYAVLYFVMIFCNVAMVTSIAACLDGADPALRVGMMRALQRIRLVAIHTLASAMLGLLSFLARTLLNPLFGMLIVPLIGERLWMRWRHLSYNVPLLMAVPVIALDEPAPKDPLKRGGLLVKAIWGERATPAHSISLLALLALLPVLVLFATPTLRQGAAAHDAAMIRLGLSIMLITISAYTQLSGLVNAIVALAAYRYATAGKSDLFPGDLIYAEHAFVTAKKETIANASPSGTRPAANDSAN
jgi:hypothetical protein